ncbi:MAG TPA: NAD(P)-dependent oxidoreductase [Flavipsychrobacter sp.]
MRILVTGSTGFTGSALLSYLSGIDGLDITAVVHKKSARTIHNNIRYVKSSLWTLPELLEQQAPFDAIFHLARISGKRWGNVGRLLAGLQGAITNKRILGALKRYHGNARLVYLSGSLMYGHNPGKVLVETDALNPTGFGKYYYYAERPLLNALRNDNSCNIIMLRAPWILGKGSWFSQLYEQHIQSRKSVPVYGNENRRMSVIAVEDCAGMLWHYALSAPAPGIYNIYTFGDIVYSNFINSLAKAYRQAEITHYTEDDMLRVVDSTTTSSILCEVVLDTAHKELLNGYQPLFTDIDTYIAQLATQNG